MRCKNSFKLRDERTPSAKYYPQTNTWADFGSGKGGGSINLIMNISSCDYSSAIQLLGKQYNIPCVNTNIDDKQKYATNTQYNSIGIHGDMASKNYVFDFEKYTDEQNRRISETLAITMNELFTKYPKTYEQMIKKQSIPYIYSLKQDYLRSLYDYSKILSSSNQMDKLLFKEIATQSYNDYLKRYNILVDCIKDTDIKTHKLKPDFNKDLDKIISGKTSIEIGAYPYSEFKNLFGANQYINISSNVYDYFEKNNHSIQSPYCAFIKSDVVTITVKEIDTNTFYDIFKNIENTLEKHSAKLSEPSKRNSNEYEI